MAGHHPHQEHRAHLHEKSRVSHVTKGYATGGAVHGDEAEDKKLVHKMVKPGALKKRGGKIEGKSAHARLDRGTIKRARGGKVKGKGTTVNVIVAGKDGAGAPPPGPGIGAAAAPPPMPPRPPMPPPGAGGPPGMPPGMPPPGGPPMMRAKGGRIPKAGHNPRGGELEHQNKTASALPRRARGGRIKSGPAWEEGLRNGTKVQSSSDKGTETANATRMRGERTKYNFKTGGKVKGVSVDEKPPFHGAVEAGFGSAKRNPFPKMTAGSKSGEGRMEKLHGARRAVSAP